MSLVSADTSFRRSQALVGRSDSPDTQLVDGGLVCGLALGGRLAGRAEAAQEEQSNRAGRRPHGRRAGCQRKARAAVMAWPPPRSALRAESSSLARLTWHSARLSLST